MPSKSFENFERYMLKDPRALIDLHGQLSGSGLGRRGLGHVTRSGVVMLCAAWELYLEQLVVESADYYGQMLDAPTELPRGMQKTFSKFIKNSKHELKPLEMAGDGWITCLSDYAKSFTDQINTPKVGVINQLFHNVLGIQDLSTLWQNEYDIDDFVSQRGEIAHTGSKASYIKIWQLTSYFEMIQLAAIDTDNIVAEHLRDTTPTRDWPWRRRTI